MAENIIKVIDELAKNFKTHFTAFPVVWITFIILLLSSAVICFVQELWLLAQIIMWVALVLFVVALIRKPMSIVYGLIGTSGNIVIFVLNFFFVSIVFATIYYTAFFAHSKISYDINQPYISFDMSRKGFDTKLQSSLRSVNINVDINVGDTVFVDHILNGIIKKDTMIYHIQPVANTTILEKADMARYQKVTFWYVLRNTIMTSLTQAPTDFFVAATIFNEAHAKDGFKDSEENTKIDKQKSTLFNWVLIFHILISWVFFGVFISMLCSKFRYES